MDLKEGELLGTTAASHWYYRAKLAAMLALAGAGRIGHVLDIGAGTGFFARQLLLQTDCRSATCIDPGYAADSDEAVGTKPLRFRRKPEAGAADLVLLMDVLEHVPDDVALLRPYVTMAESGTRFIITVPAFNWLWSEHDVFLEHYRRYTLGQIEATATAAGLRIEVGCYFYGTVLPLAVAQRMLSWLRRRSDQPARSQMRPHGKLTNLLLWLACRAELPWFRANRFAGLTAFVSAVKP